MRFALLAAFLVATASAAEQSPLIAAVRSGDRTAVAQLLAKGADVNAIMEGEQPALYWAVQQNKAMVELLLAHGANVDARCTFADMCALDAAAYFGKQDIVEVLLANGAGIESKTSAGETPLHAAAICGHAIVVKFLLAKGARINSRSNAGETPLHCAARAGQVEIVELLLANGADAGAKDRAGRTALQAALASDKKAAVEVLERITAKSGKGS